ncbi:MAG TPA: fumarylacetoacetate hydrolase family protein [Steroidobacteraceae bacterium]|nr:fumarylacetoacetate hydrolase family protein [Steroidobacteraceae bacterium]
MKLVTYLVDGSARIGIVSGNGIVDVSRHVQGAPADMIELIARWAGWGPKLESAASRPADLALSAAKLQAPVRAPRKVFAIGLNYADHCEESGLEIPKDQVWFSKAVTSVNGPFDPIELPAASTHLDHECEMVTVIGRRCRNVSRERAKEVVFGYCVGNDVSVRDWQLRTTQWVIGKSFDTHAPIGPWITTADEVQDPHKLGIRCLVNGEERQKSNTRHLVFDVYAQIEYLSKAVTLEPGDLIFTGTCGGVGIAYKPPRWLKAGDRVRVEIEGLGAIENRVEPGTAATLIE